MCKILTEKNHLCLHKGVYSVKRLSFAQQCERTFGGIAVGKAASEGTAFFSHMQKKMKIYQKSPFLLSLFTQFLIYARGRDILRKKNAPEDAFFFAIGSTY